MLTMRRADAVARFGLAKLLEQYKLPPKAVPVPKEEHPPQTKEEPETEAEARGARNAGIFAVLDAEMLEAEATAAGTGAAPAEEGREGDDWAKAMRPDASMERDEEARPGSSSTPGSSDRAAVEEGDQPSSSKQTVGVKRGPGRPPGQARVCESA